MIKYFSALALLLLLSGCSTMPQLSNGSKLDLATTAIGLSQGGNEVGLSSVCGSSPVVVFGCAYGLKLIGERYLGSNTMHQTGVIAGVWNLSQIIKMVR